MAGETGPRFAYRAFGVTLVADRPVDYLAGVAIDPSAPASLEFRHAPERVGSLAETAGRAGVVDAVRDPTGAPLLQILRTADGEILRFPGIGDFALSGNLVLWAGAAGASDLDLATVMLSAVVGYWLEERGRPILHASGVVIDGRAWLFAAPSGGGKSGLAAWLAATGCELLGDDVVALEAAESGWRAHPSFPVMRMWPRSRDRPGRGSRLARADPIHPGQAPRAHRLRRFRPFRRLVGAPRCRRRRCPPPSGRRHAPDPAGPPCARRRVRRPHTLFLRRTPRGRRRPRSPALSPGRGPRRARACLSARLPVRIRPHARCHGRLAARGRRDPGREEAVSPPTGRPGRVDPAARVQSPAGMTSVTEHPPRFPLAI